MTDRTPGAPRGWKLLLSAGFGLLLVLLAAWLFSTVPGELANKRAYAAAPTCPPGTRSDACVTTVPATVEGTKDEPVGRSVQRWLLLTEQGTDTVRRVRMDGSEPVYNAVRAGDKVTLTYWRGEIRAVRLGTAVQDTWASPRDDWRLPLGFGLVLLPLGLLALWTGWWYRYRYPSARQTRPWWLAGVWGGGIALGCAGFVASEVGSDVPEVLLITAGGVPLIAGVGGLYVWRLRRRTEKAEDTSDIVPVPPTGKRCVRATVYGDVPYSVDGFDRLVVGDGRPAATPDPDGRVARRTLPETLVVEGVRAFRPGDPDGWAQDYGHNGVVIECRDGDQTVFIATSRRDVSLVLGALVTAPATAENGPGDKAHHKYASAGGAEDK